MSWNSRNQSQQHKQTKAETATDAVLKTKANSQWDASKWSAKRIVQLRRQLGWSRTDLARRLGVETQLVSKWETSTAAPNEESLPQLDYLESQFASFSERFFAQPMAESYMRKNNLEQVDLDELE